MTAISGLTDKERFPDASEEALRYLDKLRQHKNGPRYNLQTGDRLTAADASRILDWEDQLADPTWTWDLPPQWLNEWVEFCIEHVPLYRQRTRGPAFDLIPTVSRADIARGPWSFVPDNADLEEMIVYYTSGTTGKPIYVLSHTEASIKKLALFRKAVEKFGATFEGAPDSVALAFVCAQKSTLTYATISTYLKAAGVVKINLDPGDWNDPSDRAAFLNDINPEICTGDPISFMAMAELDTNITPKALVSSAMKLFPETKRVLQERFGCPVVDIFSLCETGPIAYGRGDDFAILPDDIFVEILDHTGRPCAPGEVGEITITGGRNPYLPLLRFRTGDWAAMEWVDGQPVLRQLEGREPVTFQRAGGSRINCIDVATVLRPFPILQFSLHQNADRSLVLRLRGGTAATAGIRESLEELFGAEIEIAIEQLADDVWKVAPYSTDLR